MMQITQNMLNSQQLAIAYQKNNQKYVSGYPNLNEVGWGGSGATPVRFPHLAVRPRVGVRRKGMLTKRGNAHQENEHQQIPVAPANFVSCLQMSPVERWSNSTLDAVNCPRRFQLRSETETALAVSPEHQPI
jgi:hypothetical protein